MRIQQSPWSRILLALVAGVTMVLVLVWAFSRPAVTRAQLPAAVSGLRVVQSDSTGLVIELSTPQFEFVPVDIDDVSFERLQADGLRVTAEPGEPQLPYASAMLGIPPDAEVDVRILESESAPVPGAHRLSPAPFPAPSGDLQPGQWRYELERAAKQSVSWYPDGAARVAEVAWLRDQRVARVELHPFQYLSSTGEVRWYRRLVVQIRFNQSQAGTRPDRPTAPPEQSPFAAVLRNTLLNDEVARAWRVRPPGAPMSGAAPSATLPLTTTWYKLVVDHDGLYRLTYAALQAAGMPVASIDPRTFRLTSQGDEVAIEVAGESDGHFDPGDYVIFYGQKFYGNRLAARYAVESSSWLTFSNGWHPQYTAKWAERYTENNVYWLTVGDVPGLRVGTISGQPGGSAPQPAYYTATVHAEDARSWQTTTFTGEDPFFWQRVISITTVTVSTYTATLSAIAAAPISATIRGEVVGVNQNPNASPDHHTRFYMNTAAAPFQDVYWDGMTRLHFEGQVAPTNLVSGLNLLKMVAYTTTALAASGDRLLFDWYEVLYPRQFRALNDQITFNGDQVGARQYRVGGFLTNTLRAYNVTNPLQPQRVASVSVSSANGAYTATFEVSHTTPVTYIVASANALQSPKAVTRYQPPDLLSGANGADYLIITSRAFYTGAQTLAAYRAGQGFRTKVVDLDDVFNEFDDGIYNPIAIKNFLKYAYEHWQPPAPLYALLVGDGHWNLKYYRSWYTTPIYMPPNLAWVDPWQGEVDSANLLANFVGIDPLPDMIISRILVNSAQEMDTVVSKTIAYEQAGFQPWQKNNLFIADSVPDKAGDFVGLSEYAIQTYMPPQATALRIYENDYGCHGTSASCAAVRYAITNTLNVTGVFLMNYVGHGSVQGWSGESIFTTTSLSTLSNTRLPIILSWTCLDGYWPYPRAGYDSLIESALRASNGGAVAAFSPTGLGVATGHDSLQRGFYNAIFRDGVQRVGLATVEAKFDLYASGDNFDLINTFTLFGDPALRLPTFSIAAAPLSAARSGANGTVVTYTFAVSNLSYLPDSVTAYGTSTWPVTAPTVAIGPGQTAGLVMSATIPLTAPHNSQDAATVTIQSLGDETHVTAYVTTTAIRYAGQLTSPAATRSGNPGAVVTYPVQLSNLGGVPDTFDLTVPGHDWPASLSPTQATLGVSQSVTLTASVTIPMTALATDFRVAQVQAKSRGNQSVSTLYLTTTVNEVDSITMTPSIHVLLVKPGDSVTHTLRVTNTGNLTSAVGITGSGSIWPTTINPTWIAALPPRTGADIAIRVQAPFTSAETADRVNVTSVLQAGKMPSATAHLTSTMILYNLFLPLMTKNL